MIKKLIRIGAAILLCSLSSCFVSLPSTGTPTTKAYHGELIQFDRQIDITKAFNSNTAWEHPLRMGPEPKQQVIATIPAGAPLRVRRTVSARLPAGKVMSIVCYSPDFGISFEVSEHELQSWGTTIISKPKPGEQGDAGNRVNR